MKINHLAHASFRASDLEKSLYFYEECLGLQRAFVITMGELSKYDIPLMRGYTIDEGAMSSLVV